MDAKREHELQRKGVEEERKKNYKTIQEVEAAIKKSFDKVKRCQNAIAFEEGRFQALEHKKLVLIGRGIETGTKVKCRFLCGRGRMGRIIGKEGILVKKRRKRALVDFGSEGKWLISFEHLVSADDGSVKGITPEFAERMSKAMGAINDSIYEANEQQGNS